MLCPVLQTFCDIDLLVYASVWLPWPFAEVRHTAAAGGSDAAMRLWCICAVSSMDRA